MEIEFQPIEKGPVSLTLPCMYVLPSGVENDLQVLAMHGILTATLNSRCLGLDCANVVYQTGKVVVGSYESSTRYARLVVEEVKEFRIWADADGDVSFPGSPSLFGAYIRDGANVALDSRMDSMGLQFSGRIFMNATQRALDKPFQLTSAIKDVHHQEFKAFAWNKTKSAPLFKVIRDGQTFAAPASIWTRT